MGPLVLLVVLPLLGCALQTGVTPLERRVKVDKYDHPIYTPEGHSVEYGQCPVRRIVVTKEPSARPPTDNERNSQLSASEVLKHIGYYPGLNGIETKGDNAAAFIEDLNKLPYADVHKHFFSCWDSRSEYAVLGTPAGDAGEFIVALSAIEKTKPLSQAFGEEQVLAYFQDYLASRDVFYAHTSSEAVEALSRATGVANPMHPETEEERDAVIRMSAAPEHVGCSYLRSMILEETRYRVRSLLVKHTIKAILTVYLDPTNPLTARIRFPVLQGYPHEQQAFVNILSPSSSTVVYPSQVAYPENLYPKPPPPAHADSHACQYHAPLIVPRIEDQGIMCYHAQSAYEGQARMAQYLQHTEKQTGDWMKQIFQIMNDISARHLQIAKQDLGSTPIYVAEFKL